MFQSKNECFNLNWLRVQLSSRNYVFYHTQHMYIIPGIHFTVKCYFTVQLNGQKKLMWIKKMCKISWWRSSESEKRCRLYTSKFRCAKFPGKELIENSEQIQIIPLNWKAKSSYDKLVRVRLGISRNNLIIGNKLIFTSS